MKKSYQWLTMRKRSKLKQLDSNSSQSFETNFTIAAHFLGKTAIRVRLLTADEHVDDEDLSNMQLSTIDAVKRSGGYLLDVWVSQERGRLVNRLFLITLIILIVIANTLMGCELDLKIVLETVKKPVAPLIGFCTQFIAMPLLAYGIANVVFVSRGLHSFALGLFVTGCAPGGGASNYWTLLLSGNLPVSITMTFVSTVASIVMMPLWMWVFGQHFLRGYDANMRIKIPYWKIISSLLTLVIPLLIGILISRWKPAVKDKARKFMRPFIVFVLIFLVVFGTIANFYMIRLLTWTAVIGGLLLPWCGFTIGCFTAVLLRQPPPNVTAIAIETGIQNTGIAIMLLKFSFPDPDADISALIPVIAASLTPVPLLSAVGVHAIMRHIKKRQLAETSNLEEYDVKEVPVDVPPVPAIKDVEEGSPLMHRLTTTPPGEGATSVNPSDSNKPPNGPAL
uniref:p3 protein n=1 Tax=Ascaris suum TaxID=6253 RepID=F1L203_ASCSU